MELKRQNLWNCPRNGKETAYQALVQPTLEYASAALEPHYKKHIDTSETVQKEAARFCCSNYQLTAGVSEMLSVL